MRCLPIFLTSALFLGCGGGDDSPAGDSDVSGDDDDSVGDDDDSVGDDDDDDTDLPTCSTWVNTYDLTGTRYFIDAVLDFAVTLEEPYDADATMGPGTMTIRFADNAGAAADGPAHIVDYSLSQDYLTGNAQAIVHTELENTAAGECGVGTGALLGTELTWTPEVMTDHCQNGQVSCVGIFCGAGGSPEENVPVVVTNECDDYAIGTFTFAADLSSFTHEGTVVYQDDWETSAMQYAGTLVSSELDPNTPACLCP